ncbi:uncharacterized protein LOC129220734 [Uloborus diversus]|uniref:uncharacterized protein LOC129220734 n=1 Tax=Uloborus diversus TaxID=327109 RepID=UPI002408FB90|nr:uncharacterized protein LOC129220734 [Uloborus diversus]
MPLTNTSTTEENSDKQIAYVGIKPPPFWKSNPQLWFLRLEAQFTLANITNEITKFNHVVAAVDADILTSVSDIIVNPPKEKPYETLKQRLINSHSESEESKIHTLWQGVELGDSRPSHLLARMRNLAGDSVGEALLKSLWLTRLPSTTRSIVGALSEELSKLAAVADKIHDLAVTPEINATYSVPQPQNSPLEAKIADLIRQVSELAAVVHERGRSRDRRYNYNWRNNSRSRSRNFRNRNDGSNEHKYCWYHYKCGEKSTKCVQPCQFRNQNISSPSEN